MLQGSEERTGPGSSEKPVGADSDLTLSQAELIERVSWLIRLRWLAFVGVLATIVVAKTAFTSKLPWNRLFLAALGIPAYNFVCYLLWRWANHTGGKQMERASSVLANAQITCDLIVLAILLHLSGGVENPFAFYFVFHMVIASILLSRRAVFAQATLVIILFGFVGFAEHQGLLPHYQSPIDRGMHKNAVFVFASGWALATCLYLVVYLATSIAATLRLRENQVVLLSRRARNDAEELRAAYQKLSQIDEAKSAYARKVAHELRSPLAAIESLLRVVADGLQGEVSKEAGEMIARARRRVRGLLAVVSDLLTLASAREPQDFSRLTEVDVPATLKNVAQLLTAQAHSRAITIEVVVPDDTPPLNADQEGIDEALTNLIGNAVRYSHDGGRVDVRVYLSGDFLNIEVSDSGIGIADSDKEHVFDEFFRARNARDFASDGTGLGLCIVKSIVDAHHGRISVESELGEGTTFRVSLPLQPADSDAESSTA